MPLLPNIVQVCPFRPPGFGGVERVAHEIANFFVKNGSYASIFYFYESPSIGDQEDTSLVTALPLAFSLKAPFRFIGHIRDLLRSSHLSIYHLPSVPVFALLVLTRLFGARRSFFVYWHAFLSYPGKPLLSALAYVYERIVLLFIFIFNIDVITTSPVLRDNLVCVLPSDSVHIIPPVLPPDLEQSLGLIRRQRDDSILASFRIVYIGRLASYKRPEVVIKALSSLPSSVAFDIIGDGPKRQYLEDLVDSLYLRDRVFFHGRIDEESKLKILKLSSVLCLPSISSNEAFGIVQLEAMAAGIPPLAVFIPKSGVQWVGDVNSLLPFQNISLENLSSVLSYLCVHPQIVAAISKHSVSRYDKYFSRRVWHSAMLNLFLRV